jgi:hypothetical protein
MTTALHRLGFHYYPDEQHYSDRDLADWLPELEALQAHWLVVRSNARRSVPESFLRGLIEAGIQPIIHLPAGLGTVVRAELEPLLQAYAHWGVRHVVVHDRPNMRRSWRDGEWSRPNLVDRYLDAILPALLAEQACGLRPVLPPLEPGGDYWDTAFLQACLEALARRAPKSLLADLAIGLYAWTYGHDLDWGSGGPEAWPEARPYTVAPVSDDHRGFRIFEWYQQIAAEALGASPPMLVLAGGSWPVDLSNPEEDRVAASLAIRRVLAEADESPDLQAFAFYPLIADSAHPDAAGAWYTRPGKPDKIAEAFKAAATAKSEEPGKFPEPRGKSLRRYILLPADSKSAAELDWAALSRLAVESGTSMGTSIEDAARSSEVLLAGPEALYAAPTLHRLHVMGCIVLQQHTAAVPRPNAPQPHAACSSGVA